MSKNLVRNALVILLGAASLMGPLFAQAGVMGGRWWRRPQLARQLGLQRNQPRQIDGVFQRYSSDFQNLRRELNERDDELNRMLGQENLDRERIVRQIDSVEQVRHRLARQRAMMLFEVREVLTLEQWNRLQQLNRTPRDQEPPSSDR